MSTNISEIPEQRLCAFALGVLAAMYIPVVVRGHVEYEYDLADDPVTRKQQLAAIREELRRLGVA